MDRPIRPDGRDPERVLNAFRSIVKALRIADRAGLRDFGLGAAQLFVLHELDRKGTLSASDLAEKTATDQSTVSVVVSKLVKKGYVAAKRSPDDARRRDLSLTAKGRRTVATMPPPVQETILDAVRSLPSSSARALADRLAEIVAAMGASEENPPMFLQEPRPARTRRRDASTNGRRPAGRK